MNQPISLSLAALLLAVTVQAGWAADNGFFTSPAKPQSAPPASAVAPVAIPAKPTLADFDAADNSLAELWTRLPFTARHVMFMSRKASVYGDYEARESNVFKPGEKLLTYLEPAGYGWKALGAGLYDFGVTTDFEILTRDGKVLGGQLAFQKVDLTSHYRNREFFLTLTLTMDGLAPGDYVLAYTLHDNVSAQSTRIEQPFTIKVPS